MSNEQIEQMLSKVKITYKVMSIKWDFESNTSVFQELDDLEKGRFFNTSFDTELQAEIFIARVLTGDIKSMGFEHLTIIKRYE